jgi:hypothetical protein
MSAAREEESGPRAPAASLLLAAVAVAALTGAEIAISGAEIARAPKVTAMVGLLLAKAATVGAFFMGARFGRRSARLTLVAVAVATGYAVVLMLEAAWRARLEG